MDDSNMEVESSKSSAKASKQSSISSKMSVEDQQLAACTEEIHSLKISNPPLAQKSSNKSSLMSKNSGCSDFSFLQTPSRPLLQKFSIESNVSDKMRKQLEASDLFDTMTRESEQTKEFTDPYRMSYGEHNTSKAETIPPSTDIPLSPPPPMHLTEQPSNSKLMDMVIEDPQQYTLRVLPIQEESGTELATVVEEKESAPIDMPEVGCKCLKSKCIQKYCDCFARGRLCNQKCACHSCSNNQQCREKLEKAKHAALEKDPEAFSSKLEFVDKGNHAPSLACKRGCNCKKTMCYNKYCECFDSKVQCTSLCKCRQCLNGGDNAFKE